MYISPLEAGAAVTLITALLACSALVSGSEVAFFSLTTNDFERLRQEKSKVAQRILLLKERPRVLLATILIANNFVNIAIVIVSDFILRQALPLSLEERWSSAIVEGLGLEGRISIEQLTNIIHFIITVIGVTFLLVLFGEVVPKVYARLNNILIAKLMSGPLLVLIALFRPFSYLLVRGTSLIETKLTQKNSGFTLASKRDYDEAIDLTVSREKNAQQDVDLLKSIVKFGDVSVKQIMRSRMDIVAVDVWLTFSELLKLVRESGYSRLPVYENDLDNIKGILYVKDLIGNFKEGDDIDWRQLVRTNVLFVPESKKISDMLKDFQHSRLHMAIVVDEYGGTSGIVTLEDIMEEVIGDIRDEFDDEPEIQYKKIDDQNYLFEGKTMLQDVSRILGIPGDTFDEVRGEADSIAGLILEIVGFIPKIEREITFKDFKLKVVAANEKRIEQVLLTIVRS